MRHLNLRDLRTFVTVVEAGGVARAAARLNMTQPTASRQIDALESELGVPLFERIGRRVQLTSAGEDLLSRGRQLLSDAESLGERARALKSGEAGTLRVGSTPQAIESLLVDFLAYYRPRHPGVEVRLVEEGGIHLPDRLERGDVQLTVMPEADERFRARTLYPVYVMAAMAPSHSRDRRASIEVEELREERLLMLGRAFASREWFYAVCQVARVRPHVLLESAAPQTVLALAAGGHGTAVIPSSVLISGKKVKAVPIVHRGVPIGRWTVAAWSPQRFLPPYAEQFVAELESWTKRNYPSRDLVRRAPPLPRPRER